MKYTIDLYIRTDIRTSSGKKVPNGKMASQVAHALMGAFLSLFENQGDKLVLIEGNNKLLDAYLENRVELNLKQLDSFDQMESLKEKFKNEIIVIEDQGRTSFSEPTVTTAAVSPFGFNYKSFVRCNNEMDERYTSKQVIVINKDEIKDKWEMYNVVAKTSLNFLIKLVKKNEDVISISLENSGLKMWINGSFAKITIKPKEKTFNETLELLKIAESNNIYTSKIEYNGVIKAVAFGADYVDLIDDYTKEGYSLA